MSENPIVNSKDGAGMPGLSCAVHHASPCPPMIYKQISRVMKDIDAITKDKNNAAQGFKFRGIDDVYNSIHSKLAEHGVFTTTEVVDMLREERTSSKGAALNWVVLKIKFTFFAEDGSSVHSILVGEAMDSGDKASNKAMAIAHKYAFLQIFAIPTKEEEKDPDSQSHELGERDKEPGGGAGSQGRPAALPPSSGGQGSKTTNKAAPANPQKREEPKLADYVPNFGAYKGKKLVQCDVEGVRQELQKAVEWELDNPGKINVQVVMFKKYATEFLEMVGPDKPRDTNPLSGAKEPVNFKDKYKEKHGAK